MPLDCSLLIVESDAELRRARTRIFLDQGIAVTALWHPRQALAAATLRHFDVALLDATLPETSAIELMRMLHRRIAHLQVILLTGPPDGEADVEAEALRSGAFDCVPRRCATRQLIAAVERALDERGERMVSSAARITVSAAIPSRATP
jgi:DNA-binding NtrC family response regulator